MRAPVRLYVIYIGGTSRSLKPRRPFELHVESLSEGLNICAGS